MRVLEARVMDAKHLELAQPIDMAPGGKVVVTVLDPSKGDVERDEWLSLSSGTMVAAYGDSEPEYTIGMIKEPNPEYIR